MKLKPLLASCAIAVTLVISTGVALGSQGQSDPGAVYTMSNAVAGNEVLVFDRAADGLLTFAGAYATGGNGSGDGLGNQAAVVLDQGNRWLFVVNAGSNEVSVFRVEPDGLTLVDVADSGGVRPISVAIHGDLLYVLHAGGSGGAVDGITGFVIGNDGELTPIPASFRPLSAESTSPAQVEFTPDGRVLVVTEKATQMIDTYTVLPSGLTVGPNSQASVGATPFGFAFGKRVGKESLLLVSEAAGGAPDGSSVSSYGVSRDGTLRVISPAVPTTETAACWQVVTKNGRYTYTTNGGSGSLSGFSIGQDGSIELLDADGQTGLTGPASVPLDMAISTDGHYLYTLNSGTGAIGVFRVEADGSLTAMPFASGLPATANGMAAR